MTTSAGAMRAFRDRLEGAGLATFADSLVALARPSVRLVADPMAPVPQRGSRLGGFPDLPSSAAWPCRNGEPLSFIAQIDLAEMAPTGVEGVLPRDGLLSFFYDAVTQEAWGFSPSDHGSAAVMYTAASVATEQRVPPVGLPPQGVFRSVTLCARKELTFAPWSSHDVELLGMTEDQQFAYAELLGEQNETIHRLLGHPDPVQGDMQVECQLVSHGLYCGDGTGYEDPRAEDLLPGAADWRLLLQVDSQDDADMMWGDVGRLYYWMRQPDLVAHAWERNWLILQCG